ncbi:MAG: FliM/FliN family flagellar motor switch protein [Hoeflea sp.]|uniref:FliM/FliN family flagellar motor switch protein n=1 Tax=Hoeflea sp. TaxID=1940281 RepID=UPI0032EE21FB
MSSETTPPNTGRQAFNSDLLDRMIGAMGDAQVIDTRCQALMQALCAPLEEAFQEAANIEIIARPGDIHQGRRRNLLQALGQDTVYCESEIPGWSQEIASLCGTKLIIALVECLLGGSDPEDLDIVARPLSAIELDMSLLVFEQLNEALQAIVAKSAPSQAMAGKGSGGKGIANRSAGDRPVVNKPLLDVPEEESDTIPDFHAAALTINLEFGNSSTPLTLIVPQSILLKTKRIVGASVRKAGDASDDWTERLSERVSRSQINLQAAVALAPLPLGDISRLQPGDLIGFADNGDIQVTLSANGKALYSCALGKSGSQYMVKVEGPVGPDENWRSDFS